MHLLPGFEDPGLFLRQARGDEDRVAHLVAERDEEDRVLQTTQELNLHPNLLGAALRNG